jgi:hypothetical protein
VDLKDLEMTHSSNQCHDPVMVRLKYILIQDLHSQAVNEWSNFIDVFVEESEVLVLGEIKQHLFKAKLHKQISPGVSLSIVVLNYCLLAD